MTTIYLLTIRQLLGKWRLLILLGLSALPLIPALIAAAESDKPTASELDDLLFDGLLASAILPVVVLAVATAAFGNEVEDKTLGNLTLTPTSRWRIVAAKLAAAVTVGAPFLVASSVASVLIGFLGADVDGAGKAAVAAAVSFAVGVGVYSAIFLWAGLVTSHPLGFGLLYVFVWEGLFASFVDGIKYLSIRHYTLSIVTAIDGSRFSGPDQDVIAPAAGIVGAAVVFLGFVFLTVRRIRTMDVV
jgi:ABC-type transport system involved in multi-copper enzyme maturation permease subunit